MRRSSSVDASLSLHPAIQAALGSLDVQLEAELVRYRRQRHMQRRRQQDAKPMNLIAVQAIGGRTQPQTSPPAPVPEHDPWQTEPPAPLAVRPDPVAPPIAPIAAPDFGQASIAANSTPDRVTVLQSDEPAGEAEPDDYLASSEELLRSLAEEADLRRQRQAQGQNRLLTPLGIGSLLLMLLSSATLGYLVLNPGTVQGWKLDRFWNRSPQPVAVTPETNETISTAPSPDLSSEEFRDLNLDTLSTLPTTPSPATLPAASPIAPSSSSSAAPASAPTTIRPQETSARPAAIASPPPTTPRVTVARRPTLAPVTPPTQRTAPRQTARSTQSQRSERSTPSARPATRTQQPTRSAQRTARPAPASVRSAPVAAAPRRPSTPAAARPAPSQTAARPANPARYRVVSPYSGDRSLEQAQQVVGDAYVRNSSNGAQVQYGAFSEGDRARELSQQLQQQGISAQVVEQEGN